MKHKIFASVMLAASCVAMTPESAVAQTVSGKNIYAYKDGAVVFRANTAEADSLALEENKTVVAIYRHGETTPLYKANYADIDSLSYTAPAVKADLLDIVFDEAGNCWDSSDRATRVDPTAGSGLAEVNFNKSYNLWEGHFYGSSWSGAPKSTCYKADYSIDDYFKEALGNGHTMECLFKVDYDGTIPDTEAKFFSAHEGGGTGFLICTKSRGKNKGNEITFLPNVTQSGNSNWIWATSGVVPQPGRYYHVVGVWNKDEGKAYVYVDGQLMNTVSAVGNLRLPGDARAQWVGIGCDANTSTGAQCADSHVAIARIYDKALTQSEVDGLWNKVAESAKVPVADLLDVKFTENGGAEDVSPMKNPVEIISPTGKIETYYNSFYGKYAAKINNKWSGGAGDTKTYCKVDFENNQKFRDGLADGHSIETVWKATYKVLPNSEAKWFSAMEGGGTGFLICTQNRGKEGGNEITFLPNVTTDGKSNWRWATSGVVPVAEKYYNVVGVWNKEEGKAYVYVNGELKNTVDAQGDFRFASKGANWWGIGCDANPSGGQGGGNWEIVSARVYDNPLDDREVANLWNSIASATKLADDSVAANQINPEDTMTVEAPKADLMAIEFGANGEVKDLAIPAHNPTWMVNGKAWTAGGDATAEAPVTYFNSDYNRYVARFDNEPAGKPSQYVLAYNYEADQVFKDSIANGHTFEILVSQDYTDGSLGREVKPFCSHQGGGTGLMIENEGDWTFLPHTGGYRWAKSGVRPVRKQFYHVVGVYNKEEQTASVYVDGVLKNTVDAPGNFQFASAGNMRMIIGGDATGNDYGAEAGWKGDIVFANIYAKPLTTAQVRALYKQANAPVEKAPKLVTDVRYFNNVASKSGSPFTIYGKGFKAGDKIAIVPGDKALDAKMVAEVSVTADGAQISLPENIVNDKRYYLYVERGEQIQTLGLCKFFVTDEMPAGSKVIAHRGFWTPKGACQNSRASLKNAIDAKCYGSEVDVWLTTDGVLMANHDKDFKGVTVMNSTAAQCKALKLDNGENMPDLGELLTMVAAQDWTTDTTRLIIEIKDHGTDELNTNAANAAVEAVYAAGVESRVEYISFSLTACTAVCKADGEARVSYLSGGKSPQELSDLGITGLDYTLDNYVNNPDWVKQARELQMTTNVWTINNTDDMIRCNNLGIDYITTDYPEDALKIQKQYIDLNGK